MGYTEERIEHKECMSIWGERPPKRKVTVMCKGKCNKCGKEIKRTEHMDGIAWSCECQCNKNVDFHPVHWDWEKESNGCSS